jgi:flagellar biosynthesis/type III secretory pathway protein FliH
MSHFCVATLSPDTLLRADHGVLRAASLALTGDARAAAEHILADARRQAEQLRLRADDRARDAVRAAEQQTLERAADLLLRLERRHAQLLLGAQRMAIDLTLALFDRALADTTPRERVAASCRRLLAEAPRALAQPVLYLHPDDGALAPELAWEIKTDAALARGACRLEADGGEWRADFAEGAAALRASFGAAARHEETESESESKTLAEPEAPQS